MTAFVRDDVVTVTVRDDGGWREPRGRDRRRGLVLMEALVDDLRIEHDDQGTSVHLIRRVRFEDRP